VIILDKALAEREAEGRRIRVAMVGAGFMAQGVANQIVNSTPGMELVAISNRNPEKARGCFEYAGAEGATHVESVSALEVAMSRGVPAYTDDPSLLCRAGGIEAILEVTGSIDFGAGVVLEAFEHGKHVVVMNPELDGTLGPLLKVRADQAGVVYTTSDGDQPGVEGNLFRYVRGLGVTPLLMGNIKGLQDPYRNPTTQEGFARKWGQNPWMVTSFADGTKVSFEQATVANAFGLTVLRRGMSKGLEHRGHVDELTKVYDVEELREAGGAIDYVVGAQPNPGVFCLGTHDDPKQRHYLNLYKLGEGPLYSFYQPYHLCHFETPASLGRAVLYGDPTMAPDGPPKVEVVATAKVDLRAGQELDALGGYLHYGEAERATVAAEQRLLPQGVAEGCRLVRDVPKDRTLTYDDVELPEGRLSDRLRAEQAEHFGLVAVSPAGR
jgi:predicted homoserine dehydrogenase-like protein